MKNFIIFLSGCFVGACGTFIYLRKDIKKQLEVMAQNSQNLDNEEDIPFNVSEGKIEEGAISSAKVTGSSLDTVSISKKARRPDTHKTNYTSLVREATSAEGVNSVAENYISEKDRFEPVVDRNELNDTLYGREHYVFYEGDQVLSTEAGSIIEKPAVLIGTDWDQYRGIIFENTSLIRDKKRMVICEILVEPGTYSDEYGDIIEIGEE